MPSKCDRKPKSFSFLTNPYLMSFPSRLLRYLKRMTTFFFVIYWGLGLIPLFCEQVQISLSWVFSKLIEMPICAYIPQKEMMTIPLASWKPWASHRLVNHEQGETYLMYSWSSLICYHFQNQ